MKRSKGEKLLENFEDAISEYGYSITSEYSYSNEEKMLLNKNKQFKKIMRYVHNLEQDRRLLKTFLVKKEK
jgi:hypothetical protein